MLLLYLFILQILLHKIEEKYIIYAVYIYTHTKLTIWAH